MRLQQIKTPQEFSHNQKIFNPAEQLLYNKKIEDF